MIDVRILDEDTRLKQVAVHSRVALSSQANFAMDLVRIGFICTQQVDKSFRSELETGIDGVETGIKREHHMYVDPRMLVSRAVDTTRMLFAEMQREGWVEDVPGLDDVIIQDPERKVGFG